MAVYILLALLGVPLLEIAVFIEIGARIGLGATLVVVVLTAIAGTALLRQQGLQTLRKARQSLARNEAPVAEIFDGLCLLVAGALLLTPGFVTDAAGGLLFIPALRAWLRAFVIGRLLASGQVWVAGGGAAPPEGGASGPLVEGDYAEVDDETAETPSAEESKWGREP